MPRGPPILCDVGDQTVKAHPGLEILDPGILGLTEYEDCHLWDSHAGGAELKMAQNTTISTLELIGEVAHRSELSDGRDRIAEPKPEDPPGRGINGQREYAPIDGPSGVGRPGMGAGKLALEHDEVRRLI